MKYIQFLHHQLLIYHIYKCEYKYGHKSSKSGYRGKVPKERRRWICPCKVCEKRCYIVPTFQKLNLGDLFCKRGAGSTSTNCFSSAPIGKDFASTSLYKVSIYIYLLYKSLLDQTRYHVTTYYYKLQSFYNRARHQQPENKDGDKRGWTPEGGGRTETRRIWYYYSRDGATHRWRPLISWEVGWRVEATFMQCISGNIIKELGLCKSGW
ncbi:uncharacterized protein F4812DRAFT_428831 [Daldinia caldariorum]|uniref:uncharacterized protein n=1 Tax=Daldinia caldariorum TaxID=326644 RepID=UPI002007B557|nr:uncharacterized protein F4812DRAFT_428831 [Daldinia caldariorum]KAI1468094.1 hypothetical protein F4812DRAFT_428831 [Daldinia caldariorum]